MHWENGNLFILVPLIKSSFYRSSNEIFSSFFCLFLRELVSYSYIVRIGIFILIKILFWNK